MKDKKITANKSTDTPSDAKAMDGKKVTAGRQKKIQIITELSEKIARAKALVFTNYQGLTHKQLEELKKVLKDLNAELIITKNTLLKIALKSTANRLQTTAVDGSQSAESVLSNPTATLFAYDDAILPLKQLTKSLKMLGLPTIKFGIIDNQVLAGDQLLKLASLPAREVLIAQIVFGLKSPIFGLHRALNFNLQKLVITLSAIRQKKA